MKMVKTNLVTALIGSEFYVIRAGGSGKKLRKPSFMSHVNEPAVAAKYCLSQLLCSMPSEPAVAAKENGIF